MVDQPIDRMPVVFFGHGNPMYALGDNRYADAWNAIGRSLAKPRAVLMISAHWETRGIAVTAMDRPRTIHDFGGFPPELFAVRYDPPGDPALAARVRELLDPDTVALDQRWGLDHGTWAVLRHVFPDADVPVVQLSLDATRPPRAHLELARRLAPLRDEGILVAGSGNIVHNLRTMDWEHPDLAFAWATRFDRWARDRFESGDSEAIADYAAGGEDARLSAPTAEHFLPLLYVAALRRTDDSVDFPVEGIEHGSIGMRTCRAGAPITSNSTRAGSP